MTKLNASYFGIILLGALARLAPHAPNFTPVGAMAFFAGNKFANRWIAMSVPLLILAVSDLLIGWHSTLPFVYLSFLITVGLGRWMGNGTMRQMTGLTLSSLIFFAISNAGVWLTSSFYPKSMAGLMTCYAAALPFLRNELAANLIYGLGFLWIARAVEKTVSHQITKTSLAPNAL